MVWETSLAAQFSALFNSPRICVSSSASGGLSAPCLVIGQCYLKLGGPHCLLNCDY